MIIEKAILGESKEEDTITMREGKVIKQFRGRWRKMLQKGKCIVRT